MNSVDSKRAGDTIAEYVDAGPLGNLPDVSIADALGRMPGVTTVRNSGQASQLNIRGMNGDFIQTTLNGREQSSTAGFTENTRWMSFDQYPAELITQAAVYKSPKASLIEGGVAGLVDLKTVDPLSAAKKHNFFANARVSYNDAANSYGGDETGSRISASYTGKFLDDTLGFAVGYSFLDQPNTFVFARGGADDANYIGYDMSTDYDGDGNNDALSRSFQWQAGNGSDERTGYLASVVFEPNDKIRAQIDYFNSQFDRGDERQGITVSGLTENLAQSNISGTTVSNGLVTGATVSAVNSATADKAHPWFEARTEDQTTTADSETIGLNLEWYVTDTSTLTFDASTSEGTKTREDRIATMHAYEFDTNGPGTFQEVPGQAITYTLNGKGIPTATFSGVDFTDLNTMRLSRYERYPHTYTDDIETFRLDFMQDVEWGAISSFEAGVRISDRTFGADRGTFLYGSRSGQFNDGVTSFCEDNNSTIACAPQSVDGFVEVQSLPGVPDHFVVTDLEGLGDSVFGAGNYEGLKQYAHDWTFISSNDIEENTEAAYLLVNLDMQWGNVPISGNVGVRYIRSDVKAIGLQNVGPGNGIPITDDTGVTNDIFDYVNYGPEYSDTLPSLNLNFELTDNDMLRFAAAKVMGRPPVGQMKGGAGSWFGGPGNTEYNVWTDGTPYLDPFRADQLDLSYEHYFDDGGAVTAAVFWKDIESLVEGPTQFTDLTAEELGIMEPPGTTLNIYQTFLNNDLGGYIRGFELAGTKTFDSLPGVFAGLGATASYSFTQSETEVGGGSLQGENLPLPGLSENVWSTTIFWDIGPFSTHVNVRYRDEFVQNLPVPGSKTPVYSDGYTTVDAQLSYAFERSGLTIVLSGNNLTDAASTLEYGLEGALGEYKQFGRQYYLGLNYKY